jgi:hypothetical protein
MSTAVSKLLEIYMSMLPYLRALGGASSKQALVPVPHHVQIRQQALKLCFYSTTIKTDLHGSLPVLHCAVKRGAKFKKMKKKKHLLDSGIGGEGFPGAPGNAGFGDALWRRF